MAVAGALAEVMARAGALALKGVAGAPGGGSRVSEQGAGHAWLPSLFMAR